MAKFVDHKESALLKVMIAAESGLGKTGLLATLANSPRIKRMAILDLDNGLSILRSFCTPTALGKITYETFDPFDQGALPKILNLCKHWRTPTEDLGRIETWSAEDVFVVDTLSTIGQAILTHVQETSKLRDGRAEFGEAQDKFERFLAFLAYKAPCHVIFNTHIKYDDNAKKYFPTTVGSALNTRIGRYMNNLWRIDAKPKSATCPTGRIIRTESDFSMSLKSSAPNILKTEEPFDLAAIFDKILGAPPSIANLATLLATSPPRPDTEKSA